MVFNLIDLSNNINANYKGEFSGDIIKSIEGNRTISLPMALNDKKKIMDNKSFVEDLNAILKSYYNGDTELFAMKSGISHELLRDLLSGMADPPTGLYQQLDENNINKPGDNIQIGDKIEINNSGEGMTNNFAEMLKGYQSDLVKSQKKEILNLNKMIKDKDELIVSLRETIELLRHK